MHNNGTEDTTKGTDQEYGEIQKLTDRESSETKNMEKTKKLTMEELQARRSFPKRNR